MKVPILLPNIFNHPFTYESDINLKVGDYVKDIQDGWVKVIKTEPIEGNYDAYNFVGQDYGTIIADGIVTHNTSDIRLKENIELIGKSNLGINIYEFDYIDKSYGDGRYRGVMAQEVPWASIKDGDEYIITSGFSFNLWPIPNNLKAK